ncbi:type IX secretion system membrane protein PorP/SprF [Flavobacterium sp. HSC-61S13]|uniref:PorP/SprF family type IX secretion system membrane protein n=1 Tax=Flavobacterium sp. HSC-61S13 TaxID=2910963 RepID=UPI00209EC143|nr:type IX secretion system membrane protein PorP/SprF [Flavobacterium sp. HSC-61S13]MCP1995128.1 type IX secretion system PorP/SprF family membrane protein [Flavobacterium sp. HSC-61S13]
MKKLVILFFMLFFFLIEVQAQQAPHYTQYMYNMSVLNPAYAGSKESLSLGLLYRKQWVGLDGAPQTGTLFGHTRVGKKVGLGLSVITDKIGPVTENNIYGDFSYTLDLGQKHKLALGLKAGATLHDIRLFSDIGSTGYIDDNDPAFAEDTSKTLFNMGTGAFYYTDNYYVGLSVPNMLKGRFLDYDGKQFGSQVLHVFLTGGYVFELPRTDLKLKPHFMVKYAKDAPVSADVSVNLMYLNKFEIGGTYRTVDAIGGMVNYKITPNLRVGYAYDHIMSDLKLKTRASHEFILLYDIFILDKVSSSPRYF